MYKKNQTLINKHIDKDRLKEKSPSLFMRNCYCQEIQPVTFWYHSYINLISYMLFWLACTQCI